MGTVTINSVSYTVMGTLQGAKDYIAGLIGPGPDAFNALTTDDARSKFIVAATRYLYRQSWQGKATSPTQTTAFPRDNVIDKDGTALPAGSTPQNLVFAEYEMTALLAGNASINTDPDSGSNIQRLLAGPVEIQYFRPTIGTDAGATKLPPVIMDLVSWYLAGGNSAAANVAYGFDTGEDEFDDDEQMTLTGPIV